MCWQFFNALAINQIYLNLLLACVFLLLVTLLKGSKLGYIFSTCLRFRSFFLNWLIASKQYEESRERVCIKKNTGEKACMTMGGKQTRVVMG